MSDVGEFVGHHFIETGSADRRTVEVDRVTGGRGDLSDRAQRLARRGVGGQHHGTWSGDRVGQWAERGGQRRRTSAHRLGQHGHELLGHTLSGPQGLELSSRPLWMVNSAMSGRNHRCTGHCARLDAVLRRRIVDTVDGRSQLDGAVDERRVIGAVDERRIVDSVVGRDEIRATHELRARLQCRIGAALGIDRFVTGWGDSGRCVHRRRATDGIEQCAGSCGCPRRPRRRRTRTTR